MRAIKYLYMAALALTFAACSNEDDVLTQQPAEANGPITITAQLAPKNGGATRAVSDGGSSIVVNWAVDEHIAILYTKDETKYEADARITAVDGTTGVATITFSVEGGTPDNTDCTIIYPKAAAKDDHTGVKDAAEWLAQQDGTLNANLDVRVGEGKIQVTTPGLDVTTQPAAQYAIFKLTLKNSDASADLPATRLCVITGGATYTVAPASAVSELYVALPAITSSAISFYAVNGANPLYLASKSSVTFSSGYFYTSTVKMAQDEGVQFWDGGPRFAQANIGAAGPTDFGLYYAWAATTDNLSQGKEYTTANTPYFQEKSDIYYIYSKYTKTKEAEGDGRITLEACDDAATANWGGTWRMSTESEMNDLLNHTTKTFYYGDNKYNGANGVLLTGNGVPYTDKSIFFPYVGYRSGASLNNVGTYGSFWLSTLDTSNSNNHSLGRHFLINSAQTRTSNQGRQNGYPIRPMKP